MYTIIRYDTKQYFSLLGSPHFTDNIEIAQRFKTPLDATICTETMIDSNEGYETFGMIDTQVIEII